MCTAIDDYGIYQVLLHDARIGTSKKMGRNKTKKLARVVGAGI
jgi:hypothetical protein